MQEGSAEDLLMIMILGYPVTVHETFQRHSRSDHASSCCLAVYKSNPCIPPCPNRVECYCSVSSQQHKTGSASRSLSHSRLYARIITRDCLAIASRALTADLRRFQFCYIPFLLGEKLSFSRDVKANINTLQIYSLSFYFNHLSTHELQTCSTSIS